MKVLIEEEELRNLLLKAYESGWGGIYELKDDVVAQLMREVATESAQNPIYSRRKIHEGQYPVWSDYLTANYSNTDYIANNF